jgi:hypothetical protein
MQGYKFQGDIACYAHILNIVTQDILKALIKNEADKYDNQAIRAIEDEEEQDIIVSGKSIY